MRNKIILIFIIKIILINVAFAQEVLPSEKDKVLSIIDRSAYLYKEIAKADSSLFYAFNNCDSQNYKKYFMEDLEFYHDLGGLTVGLKNELLSFKEMCARNSSIRRELIKGSLEIYPLKNYGAVEIGIHRFFHTNKGQAEKLSGVYKFIHIWQYTNRTWKISRIISYGHDDMKND